VPNRDHWVDEHVGLRSRWVACAKSRALIVMVNQRPTPHGNTVAQVDACMRPNGGSTSGPLAQNLPFFPDLFAIEPGV